MSSFATCGGAVTGMDVGAVRALAERFSSAAASLRSAFGEMSSAAGGTPWVGPDAERFSAQWQAECTGAMQRAASELEAQAALLRSQAESQEQTSATLLGGGGGSYPSGAAPGSASAGGGFAGSASAGGGVGALGGTHSVEGGGVRAGQMSPSNALQNLAGATWEAINDTNAELSVLDAADWLAKATSGKIGWRDGMTSLFDNTGAAGEVLGLARTGLGVTSAVMNFSDAINGGFTGDSMYSGARGVSDVLKMSKMPVAYWSGVGLAAGTDCIEYGFKTDWSAEAFNDTMSYAWKNPCEALGEIGSAFKRSWSYF